jgi:hypothetical protein
VSATLPNELEENKPRALGLLLLLVLLETGKR